MYLPEIRGWWKGGGHDPNIYYINDFENKGINFKSLNIGVTSDHPLLSQTHVGRRGGGSLMEAYITISISIT